MADLPQVNALMNDILCKWVEIDIQMRQLLDWRRRRRQLNWTSINFQIHTYKLSYHQLFHQFPLWWVSFLIWFKLTLLNWTKNPEKYQHRSIWCWRRWRRPRPPHLHLRWRWPMSRRRRRLPPEAIRKIRIISYLPPSRPLHFRPMADTTSAPPFPVIIHLSLPFVFIPSS